jgi:hypothetical protein
MIALGIDPALEFDLLANSIDGVEGECALHSLAIIPPRGSRNKRGVKSGIIAG